MPALHIGETLSPSIHDAERPLVEFGSIGRRPWTIGVDLRGVLQQRLEGRFHFLPQLLGFIGREPLAIQHDRKLGVLFTDIEETELELFAIRHPRRMVRPDQFATTLDVLARDNVGEADHTAANAVTRFHDRHVIARPRQFIRRGQAAEAGTDDDDPAGFALRHREADPIADQQRTGRRERPLDHVATSHAVLLTVTTMQLSVEVRHRAALSLSYQLSAISYQLLVSNYGFR